MQVLRPLLLFLLLASLSGGPAAWAQDGTGDKAAATEEGTGDSSPQPIAVTDLQDRADEDERFAEQVIVRARDSDHSTGLGRKLDALAASVQRKAAEFDARTLRALPVARLEGLERHWRFDQRRYQQWKDELRASSAPYAAAAADLSRRRAEWEATLAEARDAGTAAALVAQAKSVASRLEAAEQALSAPLQRHIELGRRGNAVEARVEAGLASVADAIGYIDSRLFHADAPPLLSAAAREDGHQHAMAAIQRGMGAEANFFTEYAASNLNHQRTLNVFQLLLLPMLLWLSVYSRRYPGRIGDEDHDAAQRVLQRPISSWLMLSMIGVLVWQRDAPLALHQVAMLVALVPVLRLLPPHAYRMLGPWPLVATATYLLLRFAFLVFANTYLYRWYFLLLTLLALGLTAWLLWRARKRGLAAAKGARGKALVGALGAAAVALAVSATANLVGAFSLSEVLTGGVIDSGYMGLVLYVGVTAFKALLHLLVQVRQRSRFRLTRVDSTPIVDLLGRLAAWAATIGWLVFAMNRFRVFRPVYGWARGVLDHEFSLGAITLTLGHLLVFAVGVVIAFWVARTTRYMLAEEITPRMSLPRGVGHSIASLTYYALLLLGLLVALSAAGFKVGQLAFLFGALGVGIGFGLQNVVNNFVSGLILMFERPIQPGDVIDVGTTSGNVREIGMRATTIKTFDGADVVVPNGTLLSENLTNWTLRDMFRRMEIKVGVAYGSDPERVLEILLEVARAEPGVSETPAPVALFMELGASSLDFSVRAWTRDYDNWLSIRSRLLTHVYAALNENGIEIPFPQRDLHLRSVSDDARLQLAAPPGGDAT